MQRSGWIVSLRSQKGREIEHLRRHRPSNPRLSVCADSLCCASKIQLPLACNRRRRRLHAADACLHRGCLRMNYSSTSTMKVQARQAKVQRGKGVLEAGHLLPASQLRNTPMAGGCTPWETAVCCPLAVGCSAPSRGQSTASSSTQNKTQPTPPRRWQNTSAQLF